MTHTIPSRTLDEIGRRFFKARDESHIEEVEETNEVFLSSDEKDIIDEVKSEYPLEYVGFGGNRICFKIENTTDVVLFPRYGPKNDTLYNGRKCNLNENEIWTNLQEAGEEDEFNLIPIKECNEEGYWLIKPEITPVVEESEKVQQEWEEYGKDELWDNLFPFNEYINLMDITKANVCLWNGEFTLFDYGTKPQGDESESLM